VVRSSNFGFSDLVVKFMNLICCVVYDDTFGTNGGKIIRILIELKGKLL
jgi:hypothetical protein